MSYFLNINKPLDWTSFDVVAKLRGITGIKKIGHAGTLDPIATGLLIVAVGREATKQIDKYMKMDKVYMVRARLGETSDTYDAEGKIATHNSKLITELELKKVIDGFVGEIMQIPPMYSAKKVKGKKLYELARQGKEIEREPVKLKINSIDLIKFDYPWFEIMISCGSGTYIRSLIHDIGQELGVGAVMYELRRIKIGDFDIKKAARLEQLNKDNYQEYLFSK